MSTMTYTGKLSIIECANCHMNFGVMPFFERQRRDDHQTFYCPSGHHNYYDGQSEAERLKAERDTAIRQRDAARVSRDAARDQADAAERRRRAAKGQLTKTKKRIAAGVCPCCNRTFQDLARHMAGQHPGYAVPADATVTSTS